MKKQFYILALFALLLISGNMFAGDSYDMPFAGVSNKGTEFIMTFHPCWKETGDHGYIKIYVFSDVDTKVKVSINNGMFVKQKDVKAFEQTEFEIPSDLATMYIKSHYDAPQPAQIWEKRAIQIQSEDPIICYGIVREKYTSDGYVGMPVSALGKKYVVASFSDPTSNNSVQFLTSYTSVVAAYDNTEVEFTLGGTASTYVPLEDSTNLNSGETIKRTMNKGDVWLIPAMGNYSDLTGSYIQADKPIGVISGQFCGYVPRGVAACDYMIEHELPVESWGKSYNVPIVEIRQKSPFVRIFASEPNTMIYKNGNPWSVVNGPGGKIEDQGYIDARLWEEEYSNKPARITADKPISVTFYNQGQADDNISGDPFQMSILPDEQYSDMYLFSTPGYSGSGFALNSLVVVYKSNDGTIPNDIIFGEKVFDGFDNKPLKDVVTSEPMEYGSGYYMVTVDLEKENIYGITAAEPLMVYLYGSDYYDSYGYPAGEILRDLSSDDGEIPVVESISEDGADYTGNFTDKGTNGISGIAYVGLMNEESENYELTTNDYVTGDTRVDYQLSVIDRTKDAKAVIYAIDKAGNQITESFDYSIKTSVEETVEIGGVAINSIYPSPVKNELTLTITADAVYSSAEITVSDINGKIVKEISNINLTPGKLMMNLDVSDLVEGAYFIKMSFSQYVLSKKFIKR